LQSSDKNGLILAYEEYN